MMSRILNLLPWRRRQLEKELERELLYHLDRRITELVESGSSESAARRQAILEFGALDNVQEEVRETWIFRWPDVLARDLRYAVRTLVRSPGFAASTVLLLAIGIGANAAIFSIADRVLLRRLPVFEPERLVYMDWHGWSASSSWGDGHLLSYPLCRDFAQHDQLFEGVFCRHPSSLAFSTGRQAEQVQAELVSGSFFQVLGTRPELGRLITPADDEKPGAHPVVVVSHNFWQTRLGGARDVVGRRVLINNHPMVVIGVAPATFVGVDPINVPALWLPAMMTQQAEPEIGPRLFDRRTVWMHVFARLKPGVTAEQAQTRLQPWFKAMLATDARADAFPNLGAEAHNVYFNSTIDLLPAARGLSTERGVLERPLWVLLAGTTLLLLLSCLNVAGLLLARGAARGRELMTRLALGASRVRIVTQLLVESAVVTITGVLLGFLLAPLVSLALLSFYARDLDLNFRFDQRIFLFAAAVLIGTVVLCGLAPAVQIRRRTLAPWLSQRAGSATRNTVWLRKTIVVAQLAFTLVLLIGAGLFVQTLARLAGKDRGFETRQLVMFGMNPPALGYSDSAALVLMRELQRRLAELPAVERVGVSNSSLLSGGSFRRSLTVGATTRIVTKQTVPGLRVSPGFFAAVGTRVIAGREFNEADVPRAEERRYRSVIVNQSFARKYFGDKNPVGERLGVGDNPDTQTDSEIIGVIEDFSFRSIREFEPEHVFYPFGHPSSQSADGTFVLRVRGKPESAFAAIRSTVAALDPALQPGSLTTLEDQVDRSLGTERMLAALSSGFGAIALLLSIVGLYGIVSFVVLQRRQEIGVRIALGATRAAAVWLIERDALLLIGAGITLALPAAWALRRLVETQLYGVRAFDLPTVGMASGLLAATALAAALRPAWRAATIDPTSALRGDG